MTRRELLTSFASISAAATLRTDAQGMQLIVLLVDKTHPDIFANQTFLKRGDVIDVLPIGAHPGTETLRLPQWMILYVPGMTEREAFALKTPEIGDRKVNPMLHRRAFSLDLSQLPHCGDGSKRLTEYVVVTLDAIRAAKIRKSPMRNPFVIG